MRRALTVLLGSAATAGLVLGAAGAAQAQPIVPQAPIPFIGLTPDQLAEAVTPPNCPPGNLFAVVGGFCFVIG
ncbi:hypothetical protein NXT08_19960 [Rhodococcus pyridinivorans]|uniref:hypothetical protein n=1 Tax=Rhodococcus TaxID=1827 RepID=UPI000575D239|nr:MULTISPECIES: hypothetical protein [Rhodococcus]APE10125.1 hypothetical protein BO226_13690 [Rhodococcus sp. 2G]KHJ71222.1 hypothetical protein QR64_19060 [Rhodococcus sp. Chr-9]MCR8691197.1 hypothetical protein [Rhodococcus pyridinivorans]UVT24511.1 hypothetical protein NXT08_19960 [Rhodococcus pyridinivorans]